MRSSIRYISLGGLVLTLAAVFAYKGGQAPVQPEVRARAHRAANPLPRGPLALLVAAHDQLVPRPTSEPVAPSGANVSHTYRIREAQLLSRVQASDTAATGELARLYFDAHALEEAVTYYRQYLDQRPAARQHWLDLAASSAGLQDWDGARSASRSLLERYPNDPAGLYNLGAIAANEGDVSDAASWLHQAIDTADPDIARKSRAMLAALTAAK